MIETLSRRAGWQRRPGPVVLCILDGVANGHCPEADAVLQAHTPTLDWLAEHCPKTELKAHGTAVGLPSDGDMGNSEVGHNTLGAGRVFQQGASLVNKALDSGALFQGKTWNKLLDNVRQQGSTLHFIGLVSDGNVHSHISHLYRMVEAAVEQGCRRIRIHALLDGRDVGEFSALEYLEPLEEFCRRQAEHGADVRIASGGGRMKITMDRYSADWPMVERGWQHHVLGQGEKFASASEAVRTLRERSGLGDQNLGGFVVAEDGQAVGPVNDGDSVILFNFRGDRAIELSLAFSQQDFSAFDRVRWPKCEFAGMMEYDGDLHIPPQYIVSPPAIDRTLSSLLVGVGVRQFAISETQKYGHITYFFNGNRSGKTSEELEDFCEIPSLNIPFEQQPKMQAEAISQRVLAALDSNAYDFIRINYPNGDMIGHTGDFELARQAVECVDEQLGRLVDKVREKGGVLLVTADHGNSDEMFQLDKKGQIMHDAQGRRLRKNSHSLNPVPCYLFDPQGKGEYGHALRAGMGLSSVAATCIDLLGFVPPADYHPSLLQCD